MISINDMLLIFSTFVLLHQQRHNELAKRTDFDSKYDFVVVGSGTAGSVVASRLAEAGHRVLLLEAGGPVPVVSEVPALKPEIDRKFQWNYELVPQINTAQAYKQHRIPIVRAKVLGGGSVENTLNYNRGKVHDFDMWNREFGLENWTYSKMLPFLLRSEDMTNLNFARRNPGIHAIGGPMSVSVARLDQSFKEIFKAINESGYPIIDMNDFKSYGLSQMLTGTKNGSRWSDEDGFLQPNRNNENLHILAFSHVTKLNIKKINNRKFVKSVEFFRNKERHLIKVGKEVILCGGVFGSPQLLMLSGIGPKEHLEELGVKLVADLPVGDNLHDQPGYQFNLKFIKSLQEIETLKNFYQFFTHGIGPLNKLTPMILNIQTNITEGLPESMPDFEIMVNDQKQLTKYYTDEEAWKKYFGLCAETLCLNLIGKLMYPQSRGTVRLKSKNPLDKPLIDPNYINATYDLNVLVAGLREIVKIFTSQQFQDIATYLGAIPGCNVCLDGSFDCDEYLMCLIYQKHPGNGHFVGTCRIGNKNDKQRVLDENFKVRTIDNLRVIDASVIPKIPGGHVNAIVGAIGEMGADVVLRDTK